MPEVSQLVVFLSVTLVILLTPGPAVLYIIAVSVDHGKKAVLLSVVGLGIGNLFHCIGAVLGISALLTTSVAAFNIIKYFGAAYLLYLGIRKIISKDVSEKHTSGIQKTPSELFRQGIVVNILNPKSALFFLSFLPQFVNTSRTSLSFQLMILGLIFVTLGILTDGLYAIASASAGKWFRNNKLFYRVQKYFSGGIFIGLGLFTALSGNRHK
jgi:threonine/homoserine/homoserine lactone efflux protein